MWGVIFYVFRFICGSKDEAEGSVEAVIGETGEDVSFLEGVVIIDRGQVNLLK